jgi:hypothetical protein
MKSPLNVAAAAGLALGAVLGMAGTFVTQASLRNILWGIDALGLVMAAALLSLKFFRKQNDFAAAGFLVFAVGEAVVLSGTPMSLEGSVPAFGAGTALWATALLLVSLPREFPNWVRYAGVLSALLFFSVAARIFWGEPLTPIARPLPFFAYPFLVLTFIGWIWSLLKEN